MNLSERGLQHERFAVGGALIGAPLAFVLGQVLLAGMRREQTLFATLTAQADVWLLSHTLLVVWLILLIPAIWGLGQLSGRGGVVYRVVGSLFAVVGVIIITLITGVDFALGAIAPLDAQLGLGVVHAQIVAKVIHPLDQVDIALPTGLLLLTIGVYRSRGAPQWIVLLVLIGLAIPQSANLRVLAGIGQLIGLSCLGVLIMRTPSGLRAHGDICYTRPLAGALIAGLSFLPGAIISVERLVLVARHYGFEG